MGQMSEKTTHVLSAAYALLDARSELHKAERANRLQLADSFSALARELNHTAQSLRHGKIASEDGVRLQSLAMELSALMDAFGISKGEFLVNMEQARLKDIDELLVDLDLDRERGWDPEGPEMASSPVILPLKQAAEVLSTLSKYIRS